MASSPSRIPSACFHPLETTNPCRAVFQNSHIVLCQEIHELESIPSPRVVLATSATLEAGFSRTLFLSMAPGPKNMILFAENAPPGTLARALQVLLAYPPSDICRVQPWIHGYPSLQQEQNGPTSILLEVSQKVALEGDELAEYLKSKEEPSDKDAADGSEGIENGEHADRLEREARQEIMTADSSSSDGDPLESMETESVLVPLTLPWEREVLVEGFTPCSKSSHAMFPSLDQVVEWDEYGRVVDPQQIQAASSQNKTDDWMQELDDGLNELHHDIPSKVVVTPTEVQVSCSIRTLDFEGKSDGRSIKTLLRQVSPLKLVLIHGQTEPTEHLKMFYEQEVSPAVYAPRCGQWVDLTSDLSAYKVVLTEHLLSSMSFRTLGEYDVAWVDGQAGEAVDMTLPLEPIVSDSALPHQAVFVGDIKLSAFRAMLTTHGISDNPAVCELFLQSRFAQKGGVLYCGDSVVLKKEGGGMGLTMEGSVCEEYYKIRSLLYSHFSIL